MDYYLMEGLNYLGKNTWEYLTKLGRAGLLTGKVRTTIWERPDFQQNMGGLLGLDGMITWKGWIPGKGWKTTFVELNPYRTGLLPRKSCSSTIVGLDCYPERAESQAEFSPG
jgi:hypothetical protein